MTMQKVFSRVQRDMRGSWSAEDHYAMGGNLQLHVLTMKRSSGRLCTTASVNRLENGFVVHTPYSDYHEQLVSSDARVTEKLVRAQHAGIKLSELFAKVRALYPTKEEAK